MSEVLNLQKQRDDAKEMIEQAETALRLFNNPDFKKLILNEFCINECARYAQSSADPALNENQRADALAIAQAAGHLRRFLSVKIQMGNQADRQMADLDQAILEAQSEDQQ
jgi:hypothetical protein